VKKKIFSILFACVLLVSLTLVSAVADMFGDVDVSGCTDILVGKDATVDGSVIGSYSCDGAMYAKLRVIPGEQHPPGTMIPLYYRPYGIFDELYEDEDIYLGEIPQVEETYTYTACVVYIDDQWCGGINEYGLSLGESTIGGRRELRNSDAWMWVYSNFQETSLMSLALQRAKTAREAILVMGDLAETYGYRQTGEHVTVVDGNEAWAFEIFGPGEDWTHGCGELGAVWAAKRIPDGHVGVNANTSRIGEIIEDDPDNFMYSSNVYALAEELGFWTPGEEFIWYWVYGRRSNSLRSREWAVLDSVAPSLNLTSGMADWPFSVEPDFPVSVQDVIGIHRNYIHTGVATSSSVFMHVTQVRDWLPDPVKGVRWYGAGPGITTLNVPVYSGVTEVPDEWAYTPKSYYDRDSAWWSFRLLDNVKLIDEEKIMDDIKAVRDPAEAAFFAQQDEIESVAVELYEETKGWGGEEAAKEFVTRYTSLSLDAVSDAYWDLFDYLLFKYYFDSGRSVVNKLSIPYPEVVIPEVDEILTMVPPIGPPKGPPAVVPPVS
jgi:dipeptidase